MVERKRTETNTNVNFRLLSVASLLTKVHSGVTIEELYLDAERKFDTLIDLLSNNFTETAILSKYGYSLDDLKQISYMIFDRLISDNNSNPYITLCISEGAPLEEIKRRRNRLLHIFHPDRNHEENASGTKTMRINAAYEKIVDIYNKTDLQFKNPKTNIPHYYSHKKKIKLTIFLLFVISLLAFLGFMKKYYFF